MKLIVLDFDKNITYIHTLNWVDPMDMILIKPIKSDIDNILTNLGHRPTKCQWMLTKNEVIIK